MGHIKVWRKRNNNNNNKMRQRKMTRKEETTGCQRNARMRVTIQKEE